MNQEINSSKKESPTPTVWGLFDGAAGHRSQVAGLCEAIGLPFEIHDVRCRFPWNKLPTSWIPLNPERFNGLPDSSSSSPPTLIISCGRQTVPASLLLKDRYPEARTIHLQSPGVRLNRFDLVVAPEHDQLTGENVISTWGAMHPLTPAKLREAAQQGGDWMFLQSPVPVVGVLLGGPNRYYSFDRGDMETLADHLSVAEEEEDVCYAILPSRRTPSHAVRTLRERFGADHFIWDESSSNPYLSVLSMATHFIVTSDSISMVSEALSTGRPVSIEYLRERRRSRKFNAFHSSLTDAGMVQPFAGSLDPWTYEPPNPTELVADEVRKRFFPDQDSKRVA